MSSGALRNIEIALRANVSNYRAGLGIAAADTRRFAGELTNFGEATSKNWEKAGQAAMIAGGAMLAGFALMEHSVIGFDTQMSELAGVTGATGAELDKLRTAALEAGAATSFSASEAATAQKELAKAGVSTADILGGGLRGALDLAGAGTLELGRAAEISAAAMTQFKLSGRDVPHIADLLAAGANKSAAEVEDLGQSLEQSGLVAAQMGLSIEETTAVLAMFAQAGLKGSDGGTSLKTALQRLVPQSKEAAEMMKTLGLRFFDAEGNFVGVTAAAQQLRDKLGPLEQETRAHAMQVIFGSDAIRAATILYEQGGKGVDQWREKVDDAGYASELAATKLDNLGGDIEALKGSIETTFIQAGSGANGVLRGLTQTATDFVNGIGTMPTALQGTVAGFVGVTGAVLTAGGAVATLQPKWAEMLANLEAMGPGGAKAASGMRLAATGLGVALPGIILATTLWGRYEQAAKEAREEFTKDWKPPASLSESAKQINALVAEYDRLKGVAAEGDGVIGFFKQFHETITSISGGDAAKIQEAEAATRDLADVLPDLIEGHNRELEALNQLQPALGMNAEEVKKLADKYGIDLRGNLDETVPALKAAKSEMDAGTPASQQLGLSMEGLADKTKSVKEKFDEFTTAVDTWRQNLFGIGSAQDQLQRSMNELPAKLQEAAYGFNNTSNASIALREQMRGIVGDGAELIQEWVRQGAQGAELEGRVNSLSNSLINQAVAMGVPRTEAEKYFSKLKEIPALVSTTVQVDAAAALGVLNQVVNQLAIIDPEGTARRKTGANAAIAYLSGGSPDGRAAGGHVSAGGMYEINEPRGQRPEVLSMGGRDFLMMGSQSGRVVPNSQIRVGSTGAAVHHHTHTHTYQIDMPNYLGDKRQAAQEIADELRTIEGGSRGEW